MPIMSTNRVLLIALGVFLAQGCGMRSTLDGQQGVGAPLGDDNGGDGDGGDGDGGDGDGDGDGDGQSQDEELPPCGVGIKPCDLSNFNGATCESLGYRGGDLYCDPVTCLYDTALCAGGNDSGGGGGGGFQNPFGGGGQQNPFGGGGQQNPFGGFGGGQQNPFGGFGGGQTPQ